MIIECPQCQAKVSAREIADHETVDGDTPIDRYRACLLECPSCRQTLLAGQELAWVDEKGEYWTDPVRLWPSPSRYVPLSIPEIVRTSLIEADKCLRAGANIACVAMAGRALEGVCRHFKTKSPYLGGGLSELNERKVIDTRLMEWSQELQKHRNIAAHATDKHISGDDAKDLLEFAMAICDYVFVLNVKFEEFMKRRDSRKTTG